MVKEKRRECNIRFKEISANLHEIELNIEKNKKIFKKLEKEEAIEMKKFEEIKEINSNLI